MLYFAYGAVLFFCLLPALIGLIGGIFAAFSYIPALQLHQFNWHGFEQVFAWQGVETSIFLSLSSALISTYFACFITFAILQQLWTSPHWKRLETLLSALIAMPHVAFAIGFAFLFAPTGFAIRSLIEVMDIPSSFFDSADLPLFIKDPYGLGLTLLLTIKEVPFLLFMSLPILKQIQLKQIQATASAMGYQPAQIWWKCILPIWLNKMRFPLLAVITYGVSVVDLALILGQTIPQRLQLLYGNGLTSRI